MPSAAVHAGNRQASPTTGLGPDPNPTRLLLGRRHEPSGPTQAPLPHLHTYSAPLLLVSRQHTLQLQQGGGPSCSLRRSTYRMWPGVEKLRASEKRELSLHAWGHTLERVRSAEHNHEWGQPDLSRVKAQQLCE